ncbi:MAG: 2-oxoglutarate dehydrogenase E1 component, partial [Gammaproteobacteria bacterium]|nr:2-oxoglutarate dehydrogenase E1 component [Gammaproteobacteria bacterium]
MEKYLGMKYAGQKRFSLEGGDGLIPFLRELIEQAGTQGVESIAMGMAHRGRLNVLVNILGKPPAQLLAEFEGKHDIKLLAGDVKYHNGFSSDVRTDAGPIHVTLAFNPSHLEVVAPVVEGAVRARQARRSFNRSKVMAVHMHGDAAFCGQGVVMENFNMSQTKGYTTGGSIHIVINNQVGFTTSDPVEARSTVYCTDVAKMIEAPIFHVNGDDLESLIRVARLAVEYRMTFNKDVVIDLVCYRAHGHNEADEPSVTQPLMYEAIRKHPVPWKIYADQLVKEGTIRPTDADQFFKEYQARLEAGKPVAEIMDADAARVHGASW